MNAPLTWGQAARTLAVEFAARAPQHDLDASFPFENFSDLHRAGLLALAEITGLIDVLGEDEPASP